MGDNSSTRRRISLAAGLAGPLMLVASWTAPAISHAAPSPAPPPPNPPQYIKTYTVTASGPSTPQGVNNSPISTAEQTTVSSGSSGTSPAIPSGGGGGGGASSGITPINPSPVSSLVSANTVVIHNAPSPAKIPSAPPPVSNNPAPQHSPVFQPGPPQAPPLINQPPEPVAAPAPAQAPLITDTKPLGLVDDVMLTGSTESGTSAEIIILVLLTIGIWYYSHRVITQLTSPKFEHA